MPHEPRRRPGDGSDSSEEPDEGVSCAPYAACPAISCPTSGLGSAVPTSLTPRRSIRRTAPSAGREQGARPPRHDAGSMTGIRAAVGGRGGRIVALLAVIALATGLRLALLDRQGLWADEVFSLAIATGHSLEHPAAEADPAQGDYVEASTPLPASDFRRYLEHEDPPAGFRRVVRAVRVSDTSPPLYYLMLNRWTRWAGASDAALRLFSALWALASIPVLCVIARRVGGEAAAFLAAGLFAVCPLGLYYSVEGRMYSLLVFLAVSMVALTLALRTEDARPWLVGPSAAVSAAALLTHYFACFVWVACLPCLAVTPGRIRRSWLAGGAVATALLVLPWYAVVPETLGRWRVTGDWPYSPGSPRRALSSPLSLG